MRLGKRMLAWLLSLTLLLSVTPFSVFALTEEEAAEAVTLVCDEEWVLDAAENGGVQAFVFVPEESGRYVFYSYDNDYDVRAYMYDSERTEIASDDDGGNNNNFRLASDLTAGRTYYYVAEPYSDPSSGTYCVQVVCEYVVETLVCGEERVIDGTVNDGEQLFTFVPEEDGRYVFYSYDNDFDVECYLYNSDYDTLARDDDGGDNHNFRLSYDLTAGETYYYRAQPYSSASRGTYCVKLALEAVADGLVILEGDTATRYKYTDSTFHARLTPDGAIPESITWESSDESVATIESDGLAEFYKPGIVTFTATSENGLTDSIEVTVSDGETMDYGYSVSGTLSVGEGVLYKLTVPEDGEYTFMVSGEGNKQLNVYNEYGQYVTDFYGDTFNDYNVWLDVEYTYYIVLESREDLLQAEYSIYVTPTVEAESVSIRPTYLVGSEMSEIALSVDFLPLGAAPQSVTWKTTDESVAYVNSDILYLDNVGTTLLTVTTEEGLTATLPVEVRSVTQLQAGGQISAMLNYEEYVVFRVDVEAEGYYNFTSSAEYYHEVQVHDANRESVYYTVDSYNEFGVELQPGTYYVRVKNWDDRTVSGGESFFLEMNVVPYIEDVQIALYNHDDDSYEIITDTLVGKEGDDLTLVNVFSPENAWEESFAWESSDESVAMVNHWGEVHLYAPGTATITVTSERGVTDSITVTVEALPEITLEEPMVGTLLYGENGETVTFKFVPEEDGVYAVCESGRWYKNISVADRNGYGTSSSGYDVSCQYPMTAGDTYYIRLYNGSGEDREYSLSVKKVPPAESMNIEGGYDAVQIGTRFTLYTTFSPEDAITESVTWESGDESIATVDGWGYVQFLSAGTVTITATSENGLTATREFTVSPAVELVLNETVSAPTDEHGYVTFTFVAEEACTVRVQGRGTVSASIDAVDGDGWRFNSFGGTALDHEFTFAEAGDRLYLQVATYAEGSYEWEFTVTPLVPAESLTIEGGDFEGYAGESRVLQAVFAPENAVYEYVTWHSSDESVAMFDHGSNCLVLRGAGTATLTATSQNGLTDSVTVTVKEPLTLVPGVEVSGTLAYGENRAYQFTLEEDAWVSIVSTAVGETFNQHMTVKDEYGYNHVSWSGWTVYPCELLEGGHTYTVNVQHDDVGNEALVGSYVLTLKVMPLSSLPVIRDGEAQTGALPHGVSEVYAFIPEEDGTYRVEMNTDGSDTTVSEGRNNLINMWGNGVAYVHLTAGTTYYVTVRSSSNRTAEYQLTVAAVPLAESIILYAEKLEGFAGEWLRFEAHFAPEGCATERVEWTSSDETVATVDMWGEVFLLSVGTATITATSENGLVASEVVTVKAPVPIALDDTMSGTVAYRETAAYAFTLPENGGYRFAFGGDYKHIVVRDRWGSTIYNGWTSNGTCTLNDEAGAIYYVYFEGVNEEDVAAYDVTVTALVPATGMTIGGDRTGYMNTSFQLEPVFTPDDAIAEYVTWESSDDTVAAVTEWGVVHLLRIGTATITATSENGFTDSITVTVKDYDPIVPDTEYAFNNENGNVVTVFAFTPQKDGIYCFYSTGDETDPYAALYDADWNWLEEVDDNADHNNFRLQWTMMEGETYYLRVSTYTSHVGTYHIGVEELKLAESMTVYYDIDAPIEGESCYTEVEFGPEGCATESVQWHSSDESVATVTQWGYLRFVGGGTVTITAISENGLIQQETFTVMAALPFVMGEDASGTIPPYSARSYKWTVPEDGAYRINFGGDYKNNGFRFEDGGYIDNSWGENWSYFAELEAGETYYLYMYNNRDTAAEYTLSVTRPGVAASLTIEQGDLLHGYVGDTMSLSVTFAPEDAMPEGVTFTSANESIAQVDYDGTVYFVGVGTTVITATSTNGLRDEIVVRVKAPVPLIPDTETNGTMEAYDMAVYSFVADTTGDYVFTVDSGFYKYCRVYCADNDHITSESGYGPLALQVHLQAGEIYYLRVQNYEEYGAYSVRVKEAGAATELVIDQGDTVQGFVSGSLDLSVTFGPEGAREEEITWTSDDPSVVYISDWGAISLVGEGTATLTVTSESGLTDSITVTVVQPPALTLNTPVNGTMIGYDAPPYRFVPTKDGQYAFVLQKQAYGELVIEDANFEYVNGYGNSGEVTVQAYLLAGEVYYIHMYQYNANAQIEFTLKVTDTVPATSMTINDGDTYADFPGSGHRFDVTFGPENAAREEVTWTSSDPDIADIFEDGYAEFYQSGTVVFTATSASGFIDRITVTVLTMAETAEPLTSNRVEIDVNKGITVFSFTPTESGKYAFTSSPIDGTVDPMIRLLDAEENELARADDELEGMQFRLEYTLTAGETYYLFLRTYEMQDQADSYLLTVERAQTLTDITIVEGDITGDINDEYQLSVSFAPDGALPEGYVFTSANSLVAVVTDDGWLWLRGAGTTTVTVTSDSGLTDTITVTVNGVAEHVYDNACDTDCNLCGEVREVPHAYSSACDATCDLCGDVRVVAAVHTYDNACDAVCNLCGATRTVEHTYSGACDPLCNVCGAPQANAAAHTYDNACDTECNVCGTVRAIVHAYSGDCDVTCNVCGEGREAPAEHTHDNACDTSCNVCGEVRVTEHAYAGDCDTVCDVCGDVRTTATAHTYDNDCDTSCNVCDAVRETVHAYSGDCDTNCNVCGEERDALALHTHDNTCDTVCNVCGATRTVEHTYAGDCDTVCDICGATREALGEHEYEDDADTVCDVCGAERDAVHQYSGVCDTTCNLCGEEREVSAQHTYNNACDTTCNLCGAVRVTEHEYTAACDVDCGICGFVRTDAAAHTYDNACDTECNVCAAIRATVHTYSSACDTSCNVCGEERAVNEQHTYTNACDTSCNFCGATRTTEHIYDAVCDDICNVCDFVRTDAEAHVYDNACDTNCNVCGTGRVTVHTYAAPCDRFCDVCGEEREPLDGHTRENLCTPNCALCGEALEVTHDYSGSCDPSCNVCGAVRDDAAQHTYDNVCDTACNVCGAERAVDHVYTAACDTQCNVCGATRSVQQQHSYSNACDANCNLCGVTRTPAAHRYDNACDANCNVCGAPRTPSAHVYDNACDANCNVCGTTRTPAAHVYDNACDANCNVCGATRTPAAHVYDNACDAGCNVCGATRTPSAHVYDNDRDADCNVCGAVREVETGMIGDVDGNGKIDSTDARLVLQYAVKKVGASALDVDLADVDGNGKVDSTDARLILQYAVKKIDKFPKA